MPRAACAVAVPDLVSFPTDVKKEHPNAPAKARNVNGILINKPDFLSTNGDVIFQLLDDKFLMRDDGFDDITNRNHPDQFILFKHG